MPWGTLGSLETLPGASSRSWTLRFERRLAPREDSKSVNPASSVWLVRDEKSTRLYAAKRQALASMSEVDALVDEAASWRAACLADESKHIVELVDVFVERSAPYSVIFLAEFCSRGLFPLRVKISEPVILTLMADLGKAAASMPSPHGHISYESLLVDHTGRIRLCGFGAHRSAILRDNPGLNPSDDAFDIGLLIYELMFGFPPPESLELPKDSAYSPAVIDLVTMALSHPHPMDLYDRAVVIGAEPLAPVVDIEAKDPSSAPLSEHIAKSTDRNVDRMVTGVDIASAFAAILADLKRDPDSVSQGLFQALFKKPVSKDPLCAMRALTMLHNLMLDGPPTVLAAVRKNDKFMDWTESTWTREAIESAKDPDSLHPATPCFAGGELAFYSAMLRRKTKFHTLAAGGFTGSWNRTGVVAPDGRDVLTTRRRKVISGMADVIEMASELGCTLAAAVDEEAPVKYTALGALVSECCLAFNAALELSYEVDTVRDAERLAPSISRLYGGARALVFAVERVPSAGGEDWVEQFSQEEAPDIIGQAEMKERNAMEPNEASEFPEDGWEDSAAEKKREKKERKEQRRKEKEEARRKKEADKLARRQDVSNLSAADGALVVHGADTAATELTTMFGTLVAVGDAPGQVPHSEETPRPLPNMTNSQALASAFCVPESSVLDYYEPLPSFEGFGDDDDGEGGYDDVRAREQIHQTHASRHKEVSSTAVWAARSGYSERSLVISGSMPAKSTLHPLFCQCGLCQQEEVQVAAERKETQGNIDYNVDQGSYAQGREGAYGREPFQKEPSRSYYDDDSDSLNRGYQNKYNEFSAPSQQSKPPPDSYYHDSDSYESITYNIDDVNQNGNAHDAEAQISSMGFAEGYMPNKIVENTVVDDKYLLVLKKLRTGDKISDTPFVTVHKGEYQRDAVAIKKLTKKGMASDAAIEEFRNEAMVMCKISHPRIMTCIAMILERPNFIFVTDLMKRGTLFDILYKNKIKLTWALIRKIALQMSEGLGYMHKQGIVHRDIKSLNIFVDGCYNVKVGDFGLSCSQNDVQQEGLSGTYQYMAPEVLRGEPHTFKSDVFSYGRTICEMVSGTPPFQGIEARTVAERVVREDLRPQIPAACQKAYKNIINMCWRTVPSTRPSFPEIIDIIKSTTK